MNARAQIVRLGIVAATLGLVGLAASAQAAGDGAKREEKPRERWKDVKVLAVLDGDTIDVDRGGETKRIRFYGVDAPEKAQDAGPQATAFMASLLADATVDIEVVVAGGVHGRVIGLVHKGDVNANEELVRHGWGWVYRTYCKLRTYCPAWLELEAKARDAREGLWKKDTPTPPWSWRYIHRTVPPFVPRKGAPHAPDESDAKTGKKKRKKK